MGVAFDIPAILGRIRQAEEDALDLVAAAVTAEARRRAPVRKVFKERPGHRRRFRQLTSSEKLLAIKRANAYYGESSFRARKAVAHIRNYARAELPRRNSANNLNRSRTLRLLGVERGHQFIPRDDAKRLVSRRKGTVGYVSENLNPLLTSRGRYEVRSGRAIHKQALASGGSRVQIGGALKASIESEDVIETGNGREIRVTAGIRYAKFVEFPTTHNAAQPFLLPALHQNRQRLVKTMAAEVRKALGG